MALQVYNFSITQTNTIADLGTADDAIVAGDASLRSEGDIAMIGTGSGHSIKVFGDVYGTGAVTLGDSASLDFSQRLIIGEEGSVIGLAHNGAVIYGSDSVVKNDGQLGGAGGGLAMYGDDGGTLSRLINTGIIVSDHLNNAAVYRNGHEEFRFVNKGQVRAESGIAYDGTDPDATQTIVNRGRMGGDVLFGTGDDVYDGAHGRIGGVVSGDAGDDRIIGGRKGERMAGDAGHDELTGGRGGDRFIFHLMNDTTVEKDGRDLITDFRHAQGDRIDLRELDANIGGADDDFTFIGRDGFSNTPGELRYFFSGNRTFIEGTVDNDGAADFAIVLKGRIHLVEEDFFL